MRNLTLAASILLIALALVLPNHPGAATWGALRVFPLELPAILLALIATRGAPLQPLRLLVAGGLTLMTVLKLADMAAFTAFDRPFNPVFDLHLAVAGARLLSGSIGLPLAMATGAAALATLALLALALWRATGRIAAAAFPRTAAAALLLPAALIAATDAAREIRPFDPPGAAFTARLAWDHSRDVARARAGLAAFRIEASKDAMAALPPAAILPGLAGRDILFIFVESYGRAALEQPLYAPTVTTALTDIEARLNAAGLEMRSAWLTAPMVGGQSWLAHASVLSGLRIDSEGRYRALLASPRRTILHLARRAGWRTVAVMPAIQLAWPEADYFGYDRILAAADLGYAGKPFNWVTMPDQFTLAAFERAELTAPNRAPVFAEIALISSHAPWTPIPPLLPWDSLGDGRVFDPYATLGDPPEVLWRDMDRVRGQFRLSLDYALRTVGAFAERRAANAPLLVVLGDHQPATFISLDDAGQDVPIHVIGPPEALAQLDAWGWTRGMIPSPDAPVQGMDAFRDRFLGAFSTVEVARCATETFPEPLPKARGC